MNEFKTPKLPSLNLISKISSSKGDQTESAIMKPKLDGSCDVPNDLDKGLQKELKEDTKRTLGVKPEIDLNISSSLKLIENEPAAPPNQLQTIDEGNPLKLN